MDAVAKADVWVLLDGQVVYSQKGVTQRQLHEVDVPLQRYSDFLTIVVTENEQTTNRDDWLHRSMTRGCCIWGNPALNFVVEDSLR